MICTKCGAPLPMGMTVCPYCGENAPAEERSNNFDEETVFAGADSRSAFDVPEDRTEFVAPGRNGQGAPGAEDETEFAGAPLSPPQAIPLQPQPPRSAAKGGTSRREKKRRQKKSQTQKSGASKLLRLALIAVFLVLITVLLLRGGSL